MKLIENFKIKNINSTEFDFYTYQKNDYVLLFFFRGAWCNFCKKDLVLLSEKINVFKKLNTKILAISSDNKLNTSILLSLINNKFPILSDENLKIINKFSLKDFHEKYSKPISKNALFFINSKRKILFSYISKTEHDRLSITEILQKIKYEKQKG